MLKIIAIISYITLIIGLFGVLYYLIDNYQKTNLNKFYYSKSMCIFILFKRFIRLSFIINILLYLYLVVVENVSFNDYTLLYICIRQICLEIVYYICKKIIYKLNYKNYKNTITEEYRLVSEMALNKNRLAIFSKYDNKIIKMALDDISEISQGVNSFYDSIIRLKNELYTMILNLK